MHHHATPVEQARAWYAIVATALAIGCGSQGNGQRALNDGAPNDVGGGQVGDVPASKISDGGASDQWPDSTEGPELPTADTRYVDDALDVRDASNACDTSGASDAFLMNDATSTNDTSDSSSVSDAHDSADASPANASDADTTGPWTHVSQNSLISWPPARPSATLVYDSARHVVVMLSGDGNVSGNVDTWDLDAAMSTWTNRQPTPASGPSMRGGIGAAYDVARARTVLFAGYGGSGSFNDLWEWNGDAGTWTNRTPATLPAAWPGNRYSLGMTYDADRGRIVLFGGIGLSLVSASKVLYDDLWEWDGAAGTWPNRTPDTLPAAWPSARQFHRLAYDSARKRVVLFGGQAGTSTGFLPTTALAETWEWDGAAGTWTNRTPTTLPPAWPEARAIPALAYDSGRNRMMLFGGLGTGAVLQDLWEWDGGTGAWTARTQTPPPASAPGVRAASGMTHDPMLARMILYGGYNPTPLDDLYEWQPPTN
jgi:hypothetical protein